MVLAKSTFVRQITGVEQRTSGTIIFDGREVNFKGPLEAREAGIETVFQTLALADHLDVPDNIFLGRERTKWTWLGPFRRLDYKRMRDETLAALDRTAVKIPNINNAIQNMSGGQRQCVAIARTASFQSRLTIMDEPTAALGVQETGQVEKIIRNLKDAGEPLILVSHNMRQVFDLCRPHCGVPAGPHLRQSGYQGWQDHRRRCCWLYHRGEDGFGISGDSSLTRW